MLNRRGYFVGEFLVHGQFCMGDNGGHNIRQTRQSFHLRAGSRQRLGPVTGAADAQLSVSRDAARSIVMTVEYMKDGPTGDTIVSCLESVEVLAAEISAL